MLKIYNIIYNKIYISINNSNIKEITNKINLYNHIDIELGHIKIDGIQFFIKKYNLNKINIINNIINKLLKIKFIDKINTKNIYLYIFLKKEIIEKKIKKMILSKNFNLNNIKSKKIIIDYSSPNLMKEMHVGHLKSTIIGDSISRILEFLGNKIIRINHVGDWGINFGIVITKIIDLINKKNINYKDIKLKDIENLYKKYKKEYKNNIILKKKSQLSLYKLQNKNKLYIKIWKFITKLSINNNQKIYKKLNILLNINNIVGESFYINKISNLVKNLLKKKIAVKNNNLILIPLENIKNRYGKDMSIIIQKKNKTYLYSTIEIASIKYRCEKIKPNKIIYIIDKRQSDHLKYSFLISQKAKYLLNTKLEHYSFGIILDKNNKPLKTRENNSFKLIDLINESIKITKNFIYNKNKKNSKSSINKLSKIIGIGSLKYFDLSKNRKSNYIFEIEKMISVKNNTLIYIQYTYVRILSILKNYGIKNFYNLKYLQNLLFILNNKEEINLSLLIIKFEYILNKTSKLGMPNILCLYLYELSKSFSKFYTKDKILKIENKKIKLSKLNLCILTSKIIKKSLNLLGIKTVEKM